MRKFEIEPIKIAQDAWVGVTSSEEWIMFWKRPFGYDNAYFTCRAFEYALNYAALFLNDIEAFEIVVYGRIPHYVKGPWRFDDRAVRELIERANKLWTFKVCQ